MSWKPELLCEGKWIPNDYVFATKDEAEKSAYDTFSGWYLPTSYRAVESEQPVNRKWVDGVGDVKVEQSKAE